jgi:hypothetical protein
MFSLNYFLAYFCSGDLFYTALNSSDRKRYTKERRETITLALIQKSIRRKKYAKNN